jgi:hypothetical protein
MDSDISIDIKSRATVLMFVDYLYMVRRDVQKALKIFRSFEIFEEKHQNL